MATRVGAKTLAVLLCVAPVQSLLEAANPQAAPEVTQHQAPATFTSRVNLVSVPVVVRDSKGRAVGDLKQDDFRLFDKNQQQVIVKFSVVRNGVPLSEAAQASAPLGTLNPSGAKSSTGEPSPQALLPSHYVVYAFDDIHSDFGGLTRTKLAAEQHLSKLGPDDRAAIATTSGRVFVDFTNDHDKLREGLQRITPGPHATPPTAANEELGKHDICPPNITLYTADRAINWQDPAQVAVAEQAAVNCYGPDPNPPSLGLMAAHQMLDAGNADTKMNLSSLSGLVQRLSAMPGQRSIVLISSGFFVTSQLRLDETALMDSAIRSSVTLNGMDARGLFTQATPEQLTQGDAMRELADGTGGKFFENDNGYAEGLDLLATPPEYSYVLGFSPQNLKFDGSYHGLKVSLANGKGLSVQARRGYWAPNHAADPAEQSREEIQEAVFSIEEIRDIPLDVTTEFFKTSDTAAQVTVSSHIDFGNIKFKANADRNQDTVTVVTGLFDQDGHYVKGTQRVIDLNLRQQTLDRLLSSGMAVQESFEVPPGRYVVRVVVRDAQGSAMAAGNRTVNIQ